MKRLSNSSHLHVSPFFSLFSLLSLPSFLLPLFVVHVTSSSSSSTMDAPEASQPLSHTLYVNNINEKVSLNKVKPVLDRLFSRYGTVVQLSAHKNLRMKGQAFITYKDTASTAVALRKLQGRPVFRKPIRISYAKSASDEENRLLANLEAIEQRKEAKKQREEARAKAATPKSATPAASSLSKNQVKQWKSLPPHHILLVQNLQENQLTTEYLEGIFSTQAGFERVRLIKFRKLAFVDFDVESNATKCLESVDAATLGPDVLFSYAKK